ncbi:DUF3566 domain-containing protein [Brachybacterium sp. AOP3-A1-3]|uniref:DUF3566 domain-containing protein n=1 Tax=Brachybacterium sp. AOP3-A1-3 TaxID=3457699 RepID=UPI004034A1A6
MSTSDSRSASGTTTSPEATTKLPAFQDGAEGGAKTTSEQSIGSGKGTASKGASRSPKKTTTSAAAPENDKRGPRRVRLTLARLDPFSVMKLSFLVAIALGIATVVAVILTWNLVDAIGLWDKVDQLGRDLNGGSPLPFMEFFQFSKMVSYGTIVAVVNVVIITALGTLLAFLYNLVAALLGGLKLTFTDE